DDYTQIARRLKADLPANKIVVGNEDYFLEIRSPNYYGIETVTTPNWFEVNYQGYTLWEVTAPDIFILSPAIDTPKYIDLFSIHDYMTQNDFKLVRCYAGDHGLIEAQVFARESAGLRPDKSCPTDALSEFAAPWLDDGVWGRSAGTNLARPALNATPGPFGRRFSVQH
ncbi:MAG TPA: hypothetical protein VMT34_18340, partial [Aggregatilineales bacterium]|nr:hypothetical protein [Aggregatilineales bacterium]